MNKIFPILLFLCIPIHTRPVHNTLEVDLGYRIDRAEGVNGQFVQGYLQDKVAFYQRAFLSALLGYGYTCSQESGGDSWTGDLGFGAWPLRYKCVSFASKLGYFVQTWHLERRLNLLLQGPYVGFEIPIRWQRYQMLLDFSYLVTGWQRGGGTPYGYRAGANFDYEVFPKGRLGLAWRFFYLYGRGQMRWESNQVLALFSYSF